jgi:YfiH family protein
MSSVFIKTPHAISSKADGSMKKQDGTLDFANIEKFLEKNAMPSKAIYMNQIHGGMVSIISDREKNIIPGVDGLVTNVKGVSLCVVTADCLPITLYDSKKEAIGIIHAGYRGLLKNIIHTTIYSMVTEYESNVKNMQVMIGPGIEENCYEVGAEVIEQFKTFHYPEKVYSEHGGKYFLSIQKAARQCLLKEGILKEHIEISDQCTKCNVYSLYSYRRGDQIGRFVSSISLV